MDIKTGGKFSSIWVAISIVIYCSVRSSSWRGGDGVNGVFILACYKFHFIMVHDNLIQVIINLFLNCLLKTKRMYYEEVNSHHLYISLSSRIQIQQLITII